MQQASPHEEWNCCCTVHNKLYFHGEMWQRQREAAAAACWQRQRGKHCDWWAERLPSAEPRSVCMRGRTPVLCVHAWQRVPVFVPSCVSPSSCQWDYKGEQNVRNGRSLGWCGVYSAPQKFVWNSTMSGCVCVCVCTGQINNATCATARVFALIVDHRKEDEIGALLQQGQLLAISPLHKQTH